jgi:hypothetical protein
MGSARRALLTLACVLAALVAGIAGVMLLSWLVPYPLYRILFTGNYPLFLAANGGLTATALTFFIACKIVLRRNLNWKLSLAVYAVIVLASDPVLSWLHGSLNLGEGFLVLSWIATVLGSGLALLYFAPIALKEGRNDQTA